ncbi:MAG: hypothetical protein JW716_04100 [Candidatus Aenigmarchaeota archaeon]|nr:hypothetical protein [Candidatus Aenigmarchaeota archaeon]
MFSMDPLFTAAQYFQLRKRYRNNPDYVSEQAARYLEILKQKKELPNLHDRNVMRFMGRRDENFMHVYIDKLLGMNGNREATKEIRRLLR